MRLLILENIGKVVSDHSSLKGDFY